MTRLLALPLAMVLAAAAVGSPAAAQDAPARYAFVPVEKGALRLDTATGEVSFCAGGDGGTCAPMRDERGGAQAEAIDLERRLAALEARIAALEGRDPVATLDDEESLDRVVVLADRMMRRFIKVMRGIKDDVESGEL